MNEAKTKRLEKRRALSRCVHFTGTKHHACKAGVLYSRFAGGSLPCFVSATMLLTEAEATTHLQTRRALCDKLEPETEAQIQAHEAEISRVLKCYAADVSPCCEAPIDRSKLIAHGRFKGNGWIFCSKCGAALAHVNAGHATHRRTRKEKRR